MSPVNSAEETLAEGDETSGYYFLFADGEQGLEGYACLGPIPGANRGCGALLDRGQSRQNAVAASAANSTRGRGLARRLRAVYLVAETSMRPPYEPARRFYQSNGFDLIAEVPDWHDDGDGMAIFRKRL